MIEFDEAAGLYLDWARGEYERQASFTRIAVSFQCLRGFFRRSSVSMITAAELESFKTWRRNAGIKPVTIRHDLHALSGFYKFAVRCRWAWKNPTKEIKIPSDAGSIRIRALKQEEITRYFEAARGIPSALHDVAWLMLSTGMRPSEVMNLTGDDYNQLRQSVMVRDGKTPAARRMLQLVPEACAIVERRTSTLRANGFLFPGKRLGEALSKLQWAHNRALKLCGLRFRLYDLRHTFATRMAERGMPLTTLAAILGHNGLRCVTRYVHPSQTVMDEAMLRFQRVMPDEESAVKG